ncbi:hypothetical protein D3C76_1533070 [compost metagenome]
MNPSPLTPSVVCPYVSVIFTAAFVPRASAVILALVVVPFTSPSIVLVSSSVILIEELVPFLVVSKLILPASSVTFTPY